MKSKIFLVYFGAYIFLLILSAFMSDLWLINTQVAFICSIIIIISSFFSYKGLVESRLEDGEILTNRDELDKIDDKYELFNENIDEKELNKDEFVKFYKEERKKHKGFKQVFLNLYKSKRGVFNPLRLLAYVLLCIAMLFLIKNELFSAIPFLVGIGVIPIASVLLGFVQFKP
ncbi:MAG: hypothetical protein JJV95_06890 [Sulfurospirillum sp.]|nr:hypothetical protein [Sulfurospirillum sp.]MBL0703689.1 hypothetical protein [Sulfurospirillum sp.]